MKRMVVALALAGASLLVPATIASADTEETLVVQGGKVTQEYGPIPGNFPLAPDVNWTPSGCATGAPGSATCDQVPVKIPVPDVSDADDFYVEITLEWDDESDLDMYAWDNRQLDERAGEEEPGFTQVGRSASADNPEKLRLIEPELVDYNLTILNWAGANLGYRLTAELKVLAFTPPFESLAPEFFQGDAAEEEAFQPFDYSAIEPAPAEPVSSTPIAPTYGEVAITPDRDFTDFGSSSFDDELSAPPAPPAFSPRLTAGSPPDVHPVVLLFWLLLVPLAAAAGAAFFLMRRSRSLGLAWG
jgi:hypothetical protein